MYYAGKRILHLSSREYWKFFWDVHKTIFDNNIMLTTAKKIPGDIVRAKGKKRDRAFRQIFKSLGGNPRLVSSDNDLNYKHYYDNKRGFKGVDILLTKQQEKVIIDDYLEMYTGIYAAFYRQGMKDTENTLYLYKMILEKLEINLNKLRKEIRDRFK